MRVIVMMMFSGLLAACAITPEQQAARLAAQQRYEQNLQVALAHQCDPATAQMMRRQFDGDTGATEQEQQTFRLAYLDKVNDRMFQTCYKLAWQNYIAQRELAEIRHRYDYDHWWYAPRPWGWRYW